MGAVRYTVVWVIKPGGGEVEQAQFKWDDEMEDMSQCLQLQPHCKTEIGGGGVLKMTSMTSNNHLTLHSHICVSKERERERERERKKKEIQEIPKAMWQFFMCSTGVQLNM